MSTPKPNTYTSPNLTLTTPFNPTSNEKRALLATVSLSLTNTIITPTILHTTLPLPPLNLTSDKKWVLLFNVDSPFEAPKEEFDKEVANIKYKLCGPMKAYLIGSTKLEQDILETMSHLSNQEYHTK
ncbi:hypothetical protein G9A89_023262 [Geosiphon pyriformis]|nr:hypothetical protein G9A89_023262 [Geosiphon pyriformis]